MGTTISRPYGSRSMEAKLTDKQKRFIDRYMISLNATDAAIAAGYSKKTASVQGAKLLKNPNIQRVLGNQQHQQAERQRLDSDEVITQLYYCVTRSAADFVDPETGKIVTDVEKLNRRAQACIDGIDQDVKIIYGPDGEIVGEQIRTKLKLTPKVPALDLAMKHKGLFNADNQQKVAALPWDQMYGEPDEDEKKNYIDEELES